MAARSRGFTLVELAVAAAAAATLAAIALPSLQDRLVRARRADASAALQRVQLAQERHHALHGLYAADLAALGQSGASPEGLYRVTLQPGPGEGYLATAQARADGAQAGDRDCAAITLRVVQGFAQLGPSARCWNR